MIAKTKYEDDFSDSFELPQARALQLLWDIKPESDERSAQQIRDHILAKL